MTIETDIETLKARMKKGLAYCSDLQMQIEDPASDYQPLSDKLTKHLKTLNELAAALKLQGYTRCVFGECKLGKESHCFVCTK